MEYLEDLVGQWRVAAYPPQVQHTEKDFVNGAEKTTVADQKSAAWNAESVRRGNIPSLDAIDAGMESPPTSHTECGDQTAN